MNERILKLSASCFPRDGDGNIHATPEIIAEFAGLIIRECLSLAQSHPSQIEDYAAGIDSVRESIKDYFGVE